MAVGPRQTSDDKIQYCGPGYWTLVLEPTITVVHYNNYA